jgi:membrane dipeptidase
MILAYNRMGVRFQPGKELFMIARIARLFVFMVLSLWAQMPASKAAPDEAEEKLTAKAKAIHQRALTLDTHVDIPGDSYDPGEKSSAKCTIPKMEQGGLKGTFLAVYVGQSPELTPEGYKRAYDQAMAKYKAIRIASGELYPDRCAVAIRPADVARIAKTGKRVFMIGMENGYPIGTNLSLIGMFYDLGTRYITLSHSGHNQICDSSGPAQPMHNGLSAFGKLVVAEMNRLGMMIDVSHISAKSFFDVIQETRAPIIASHSGCMAVSPHDRILTDEQLRALSKNGGVVQIVALGSYLKADSPERLEAIAQLQTTLNYRRMGRSEIQALNEQQRAEYVKLGQVYQDRLKQEVDAKYPPASLADFVDHIDHAAKIAGIDHVGIGTDFDGGGGIPGFNDDSEALNVTVELVRRGYSEKDIKKIWGGNLLRVWQQVEKKRTSGAR